LKSFFRLFGTRFIFDFNTLSTREENDIISGLMSENPSSRTAALKLIYKDYFPRIEAFVMKSNGNRFDAKDVFQDGIMALYQNIKLNKFRGDSGLFTYLYAICRNVWFQKLQQPMMKITDSLEGSDVIADDEQKGPIDSDEQKKGIHNESLFENVVYEEIDNRAVASVMAELKDDCKRMLIGFYYESKSMEELSRIFELGSVQAAKNKKMRCLSYLMKRISEKGLRYENFIG